MSTSASASASVSVPGPADVASLAASERKGVWLMVAGGLLLGTIGVFVEEAAQDPLTTVWFRCLFGGLALLAWGAATGRLRELRLRGMGWVAALTTGVLIVLNWALFFAAIARTSIGVATVVFHVQPLWILAFGAWWLRERVSRLQWMSVVAAIGGVALSAGLWDDSRPGNVMSEQYVWGLLMCLGGSISYAGVTLIAKSAKSVSSFALAWWQCAVGVALLCWWPFVHGWPVGGSAWAWLMGLGMLHTGLAYAVLYAGMARLPVGRIANLQFVYPAAAVLVDWAVYGRALSASQLLGVLLMGLSLWVVRQPFVANTAHGAQ